MELEHKLRLKIDSGTGLTALAILAAAVVVLVLGVVGLTAWLGDKPAGPEISLDVRARHGLDHPQQGRIERTAGRAVGLRRDLSSAGGGH